MHVCDLYSLSPTAGSMVIVSYKGVDVKNSKQYIEYGEYKSQTCFSVSGPDKLFSAVKKLFTLLNMEHQIIFSRL